MSENAHSVILKEKINALRGNATTGLLADLHATVEAADEVLENGDPANGEAIHAALHALETCISASVTDITAADTAIRGMID